MNNIVQVKLLAVREGSYTVYVFQDVISKEYIMCTRLPNWQVPDITIGDTGFLEYTEVKAGDTYFDPAEEKMNYYKYSNVYFINFIQNNEILKNKHITL